MKVSRMILVLFVSAALLSACGTDAVSESAPGAVEITIEMSEFAFSVPDLELVVGQ
jgi:ABC-type glycerol-3-phosphate transport system substrate-binding protein